MSNEKLLEIAREQLKKREQEQKEREDSLSNTSHDNIEEQNNHADNLAKILKVSNANIRDLVVPWSILIDESPEKSPGLNDSFWLCAAYVKLKDMFHRKSHGWSGNLGIIAGLIVRFGLENLLLSIIAAIPAIVLLFMSKLGTLLLYIIAVFVAAGIYVYVKNKDEFFAVSSHDKQVSIDEIKETYELTVSKLHYCEERGGLPEGSWDDYGRIMGALYSRKYTSFEDAMLSLGYHLHEHNKKP